MWKNKSILHIHDSIASNNTRQQTEHGILNINILKPNGYTV